MSISGQGNIVTDLKKNIKVYCVKKLCLHYNDKKGSVIVICRPFSVFSCV